MNYCRGCRRILGSEHGALCTLSQDGSWVVPSDCRPSAPAELEIRATCQELAEMLVGKNRKYGDSALSPVRIASKASPIEQILVRIDDKLCRWKNLQSDEDEDIENDLLGYLVLLRIARKRAAEGK